MTLRHEEQRKAAKPLTMEVRMHFRTAALTLVLTLGASLMSVGCSVDAESDEAGIINLLNSSGYTSEDNERSYGAQDTTITNGGEGPVADDPSRVPFIRFRRCIPPGGLSRTVVVNIPAYPGWPDTTALATITTDVNGELRTMFDTTSNPILVWRKQFHDRGVRTVYLTKTPDGWRIRKLSPLEFSTVGAAYDLNIVEIKAHATSWPDTDTFRLTTTDTMLAKRDLPVVIPSDTITVWITVESSGDSCWTFLHHGRPKWPHRWRRPYLKTSTFEFTGVWLIGSEGYDRPQVRPSSHDVIGWNSLWADTSEPYVAAAWGVPYIVMGPDEEVPEE